MMTVAERAKAGEYDLKLPLPRYDDVSPAADRARAAWKEEGDRLYFRFRDDLFAEYGVTDNPKADRCLELAWEHGHPSGYCEVIGCFADLVELIR